MTHYAMFATARTYVYVLAGMLAARPNTAVADALRRMTQDECVVPLYEAKSVADAGEREALDEQAQALLDTSAEVVLATYQPAAGHVPHILRVTSPAREVTYGDETVVAVKVRAESLASPLAAADFLRLRVLDDTVASQFKGFAPSRPIQEVALAVVKAVVSAAKPDRDDFALFRSLSLVGSQSTEVAARLLSDVGRRPRPGDMAFLVTRATMPGLTIADSNGVLSTPLQPIARTPEDIQLLFADAGTKTNASDPFNVEPATAAVSQLVNLLNNGESVRAIDDFAAFYEFRNLSRAVTQAIEIAKRPKSLDSMDPVDNGAPNNLDSAAALKGLSVEAVMASLPEGFIIERSAIAAAVAALRAGKHLLLGGPPGTGKTTVAGALCRAVVGTNYDVATATADWTTFDTIGGYLPAKEGLEFVPGVVLRSLKNDGWLIIDELNRADIDKAFGPLFTVLSGSRTEGPASSVLPYTTEDGKSVRIETSANPSVDDSVYSVTPSWRLIGTLNISDKASLFRLSFAFLRRFAIIDVPSPDEGIYRSLLHQWFATLDRKDISKFVDFAVAVMNGPVTIGPAIAHDFAQIVVEGLGETASGEPAFASDEEALLTAVSLMIVPQYEGQPLGVGQQLMKIVEIHLDIENHPLRSRLATSIRQISLV